jgi:hypothetical protein
MDGSNDGDPGHPLSVYCCAHQAPLIYVTIPKVPVAAYQKRPRLINLLRYGTKHSFFLFITIIIFTFFFFCCCCFFYGVTAQYQTLASCSSRFDICDVLRGEVWAPRPTPNLEDKVSLLWSPETGWPSYTPRQWVAWDLESATSRTHSNCEPIL